MKNPQKPIHEIRIGAVKAAIWSNTHDNVTRHNVTVCRLYKDGENWKSSDSFGRDDLPLLCKVSDQAHSWIYAHQQEKAAASERK